MPESSGSFLSSLKTGWQDFNLGLKGIEDTVFGTSEAATYYTSEVNPESVDFAPQLAQSEHSYILSDATDLTVKQLEEGAKSAFSFGKTVLIAVAVIVGGIVVIYAIHTLKEVL